MSRVKDLTGQRFGRLVVVKRAGSKKTKSGPVYATWWCQCDCGSPLKEITSKALTSGATVSCGCYKREQSSERLKTRPYSFFLQDKHKTNCYNLSGDYGIGYTSKGEEFFFDLEDYNKIKDYCWNKTKKGYIVAGILKPERDKTNKSVVSLHVLVMGEKEGYVVDHRNRKKNDCRKENLRYATHTENCRNISVAKDNTTGIIGVMRRENNKYRSRIRVNGKLIDLGTYSNIEDAIVARLRGEKEYFGDFAPQKHLFEQYGI